MVKVFPETVKENEMYHIKREAKGEEKKFQKKGEEKKQWEFT